MCVINQKKKSVGGKKRAMKSCSSACEDLKGKTHEMEREKRSINIRRSKKHYNILNNDPNCLSKLADFYSSHTHWVAGKKKKEKNPEQVSGVSVNDIRLLLILRFTPHTLTLQYYTDQINWSVNHGRRLGEKPNKKNPRWAVWLTGRQWCTWR